MRFLDGTRTRVHFFASRLKYSRWAAVTIVPNEQAELTAQRFLGLRMRCAQCHDHPFDVWTQDAYYGLAAFFAKVQRNGSGPMMGRTTRSIPGASRRSASTSGGTTTMSP